MPDTDPTFRPAADTASPSELLRALEIHHRTPKAAENRRTPRHYYCVPLMIQVQDPNTGAVRQLQVASNNISEGGFAFIFDGSMTLGSQIIAQFTSLPQKPVLIGVVRSCVHLCGTQHRVGVEFMACKRPM